MLRSFRFLLLAALLALLLGACSRVTLFYRNLDLVIPWLLDDYLALTATQERRFKRRLQGHLAWHCQERLPAYRERLYSLRGESVGTEQVGRRYQWMRVEVDRVFTELTPSVTALLADLDERQVAHLARMLARAQAKRQKEYVSPPLERQIAERAEHLEELVDEWMGEVNPAQRRRIVQWARELGDFNADWALNQRRWEQALLAALARRGDADFEARIGHLLRGRRDYWTAGYRERFASVEQAGIVLVADLYALAGEEQRRYLQRRLEALAADFASLDCAAGQAGGPAASG